MFYNKYYTDERAQKLVFIYLRIKNYYDDPGNRVNSNHIHIGKTRLPIDPLFIKTLKYT